MSLLLCFDDGFEMPGRGGEVAETDDGVLLSPVSQETGVAGPLPDFRQQLASDRTLLAWLRTAISLAAWDSWLRTSDCS